MPPLQQHIVLIQNDPYLTESRTLILKTFGYSVEVVQSVLEARASCRNFRCDLVIVDADKAHNTALELCDEIKQNNPALFVVLMTGYYVYLDTDCPDEIVGKDEGPQGFITKIQNLLAPAA
jgi:two-component system response regulator GlrR